MITKQRIQEIRRDRNPTDLELLSLCDAYTSLLELEPVAPHCAGFWWFKTPLDDKPSTTEVFDHQGELSVAEPLIKTCKECIEHGWLFAGPIPWPIIPKR